MADFLANLKIDETESQFFITWNYSNTKLLQLLTKKIATTNSSTLEM